VPYDDTADFTDLALTEDWDAVDDEFVDLDPEDAAYLRSGLRLLFHENFQTHLGLARQAAVRLAEDLAASLPIGDSPSGADLCARINDVLNRPDIKALPDAERCAVWGRSRQDVLLLTSVPAWSHVPHKAPRTWPTD
jgi:hypothetical protein